MAEKPILIVDDEKNICLTLVHSLEPLGFDIATAVNGEEALRRVQDEDFGLLLMDLRLPGMDGMELLGRIRKLRPDIRIIVITAYGTIELAVKAMKLGAVDFIQKPFAPREIRDAVLEVMERAGSGDKAASEYKTSIGLATRCIYERWLDAAEEHLHNAIRVNLLCPEAYALMGTLMEMRQRMDEARKCHGLALSIGPTYEPARKGLKM